LQKLQTLLPKRTKAIAWLVSNCVTPSKRENYVQRLARRIHVDVYGACGVNKCARNVRAVDNCESVLANNFYFYLAFENSVCPDYITEKLHTAINNYLIPIVMDDSVYKPILPPHSYIAIDTFRTMNELVRHLLSLIADRAAYMKYHSWRLTHTVTGCNFYCDLCMKLHTQQNVYTVRDHIDDWFSTDTCKSGFGKALHPEVVPKL
jgi:hypothetical protein